MFLKRKFFGSANLFVSSAGFVLFSLSNGTTGTRRYEIDTRTAQPSTAFGTGRSGRIAIGNATHGLYANGGLSSNSSKFSFSALTFVNGTDLGAAIVFASAAAGNGDLAVITRTTSAGSNGSIKYVYAGDVVSAGTNFTVTMTRSVSTTNSVLGLFVMNSGTQTNKYAFASDTVSLGGALTASQTTSNVGTHTGNGSVGLLTRPNIATITQYDFSSDTCTDVATLTNLREGTGMAGTTEVGVFGMGTNAGCLYSYSTTGVVSESALTGLSGGATCSNPFGVNVN